MERVLKIRDFYPSKEEAVIAAKGLKKKYQYVQVRKSPYGNQWIVFAYDYE